jgi:2-C-methyl-D-erythritol 4-phosphate cytidylyltransferase
MGNVAAIIVAAGTGSRMGTHSVPKQFLKIGGVPILAHTLKKFEDFSRIDQILLVTRRDDQGACENLIKEIGAQKIVALVEGGKERQDSVFNGLLHLNQETEIVLIHDAVRMFVSEPILAESIRSARKYGASVTAVPVKDTIKKVTTHPAESQEHDEFACDDGLFVLETLNRQELWQIQTPQTFQYDLIFAIHQKAREIGFYGTDDAMLVEHFGHPVKIVSGSYRNIKITTPDDLLIAEAFVRDETSRKL